MMQTERKSRLMSFLLALTMVLQSAPVHAFAATEENLCDHHTEHTDACDYVAAAAGSECTHVHSDGCGYVETVEEVLCACETTDENGVLVHTEGCGYVAPVIGADCTHIHDTAVCGYVEAVEGHACGFVCEACAAEEDPEPSKEATKPSEKVTEPSTESPEPSTEATEPTKKETKPSPEEPESEPVTASVTITDRISAETDLPENDEIFALYVEGKLYGYEMATFGTRGRESLNSVEQGIYDVLKAKIVSVAAAGGSTVFAVSGVTGLKTEWTNEEITFSNTDASAVEAAFETQFSLDAVMSALVADCPFDLYWFDKTEDAGAEISYRISLSGVGDVWTSAVVKDLTFTFKVANDYQGNSTSVTTDVARVNTAKANATQVVSDSKDKTAYEKLVAYKQYICSATSYNQTAVDDKTTPYGDPWQLVNVFDGDSSTTVVCEGYAKAFQYLCDLGGLDCVSVSGVMAGGTGAGGHMWNVVTLEGKNYLVDVTNCDEGTAGAPDLLFLAGAPYENGKYSFDCGNQTVDFTCSDLDLEEENYTQTQETPEPEPVYTVTVNACQNGTVTANPTSGEAGTAVTLAVTPADGYVLKSLAVSQGSVSVPVENNQFTMPEGNVTVSAEFEKVAEEDEHTHDFSLGRCECGAVGGSCGEKAIWAYDSVTGTLTISGEGAMTDYTSSAYAPWYSNYRSSIRTVVIEDGITSVGNYAFYKCEALTGITFGKTVATIGKYAFYQCKALPNITFGKSISSIGEGAFGYCQQLTKVTVPGNITTIGEYAFTCCVAVTTLSLEEGVESVANYAFFRCYDLTTVYVPVSLKTLGIRAFDECETLENVYYAGDYVQWEGIEGSGEQFWSNPAVHRTPAGICGENIRWAFEEETGILTLSGTGATDYYEPDYYTGKTDTGYTQPWANMADDITEIVVGEGITALEYYVFAGHKSLEKVTLPESLDRIGRNVFNGCEKLTEVVIPHGVKEIDDCAFYGCTALRSVTMPATLRSVYSNAFDGCGALTDIYYGSSELAWSNLDCANSVSATVHFTSAGVCGDNLVWDFEETTGVLTISGTGDMYDFTWDYDWNSTYVGPWGSYIDQIRTVVVEEGVTGIGMYAFSGYNQDACYGNLTSVSLPKTLTRIGFGAFTRSGLPNITVPSGVKEIGDYAFQDCQNLTGVSLPVGLETIGEYAFDNCSALTGIVLPDTVTGIGQYAFADCTKLRSFTVPSGVTELEAYVFSGCSRLVTVKLPENLESIGYAAFYGCSHLEGIEIPETVTSIGDRAFLGCGAITELTLHPGITAIGDYTFCGCGFTAFTIPATVTSIGSNAFDSSNLVSITVPDTVTSLGDGVFAYCYDLKTVVLPSSMTAIPTRTFYNCDELSEFRISDSVTEIGESAFYGCDNLDSITLPTGLTEIGAYAFFGANLQKITFPASVELIDYNAFTYCYDLKVIQFLGDAPEMYSDTFTEVTADVVYPRNNETWTESVRQNYGGTLTWDVTYPLLVSPRVSDGKPSLEWGQVEGAETYYVYRATSSAGTFTKIHTTTSTSYVDTGAVSGKAYYYRIATVYNDGTQTIGDTEKCYCVLPAPKITISANSKGQPVIKWSTVEGATYYDIRRINGDHTYYTGSSGLSYVDIDAEPGVVYQYRVRAMANKNTFSSQYCEPVEFMALLQAPVVTVGNDSSTGQIKVSWKAVPGAEVYEVYRSTAKTGEYILVKTTEGTSFADVDTVAGRLYYYKVIAIGAAAVKSAYSSAVGYGYDLPKPAVKAASNPQTGGGILTWNAAAEADSYEVYRATSSTGKYSRIATVTAGEAKVAVPVGKTYYFKVRAICEANSSLNSAYSSVVKVTGKCAQPQITVTANTTSGKPVVKWSKISGAAKYYVYRASSEDGTYTRVKTTTATSYTDTAAKVGRTYFYKVRAIASTSTYNGAYSAMKSCLTVCARPAVTIKVVSSSGKPALSWGAVSGAAGYEILRAEAADGEFVPLTESYTELSYTDKSAAPDTDYWYKVNALGTREELNSAAAKAQMVHATLARPAVTFKIDGVTGKPTLSWKAVDGAVSYKVYRSAYANKSYKAVKTVKDNGDASFSYTDTSVSVSKGYYYKVIAIGANSKSAYSSYKKLTAKCAQPQITVTTNASSGKPVVKWSKISGAAKYYVYRASSESGTYTRVKTTTSTSYTDTSAKAGSTYFYKVRAAASKSTYNGALSAVGSCTAKCARPAVTLKTVASTGKPLLSWNAVSGAVSYELWRSENGGEYELVYSDYVETSYVDNAAEMDGKYSYKVKAVAANTELNSAEAVTKAIAATCGKPAASIRLSSNKPKVSWKAVDGATKYYVYRSTKSSSGFKKIATVTGLSHTDKKAIKGTTYYYKVVAVTAGGNSSTYSSTVKLRSK